MNQADTINTIIGPTSAQEEVRAVAITTLFGSFTTGGTSGKLGNEMDSAVLQGLREWADVILVGSGTVKAEDYDPADTPMAVVSRSLTFDTTTKLFSGTPPIIVTPQDSLADPALTSRRKTLEAAGCELVEGGGVPEVVDKLRARGFGRIVCEGGPSLYTEMFKHSLIDVLHLTLDPHVNGEPAGLVGDIAERFTLEQAVADGDYLFTRYRRVQKTS